MLRVFPILVSAALLAACGQKGPLFLATVPAGAPTATGLTIPSQAASAPPATGTASPVRGQ